MPYGITQCYLPPDRGDIRPYPSRSWYSIKQPRRDARLSWPSSTSRVFTATGFVDGRLQFSAPPQNPHPLTDRQEIWYTWLCRWPLFLCQIWCKSVHGGFWANGEILTKSVVRACPHLLVSAWLTISELVPAQYTSFTNSHREPTARVVSQLAGNCSKHLFYHTVYLEINVRVNISG